MLPESERWVYWLDRIREKYERLPDMRAVNFGTYADPEIWDDEVIPLRQPIEECE